MTAVRPGFALTLAIHPNSHGFGWIAFESTFVPYNWGTVRVREGQRKNAVCLARAKRLLDHLEPAILVLEEAEHHMARRADRIKALTRALIELAQGRGLEVATYPFTDVSEVFGVVGARTRQEIAEAVARHCPVLSPRLPKRRRAWETEREGLAIFCAAALVMTHDRLDGDRLLDGLV
jgi:hypothetical protein